MTKALSAFAVLVVATALSVPALAQDSADDQAVRAAVFDYFEGQGERSQERLERAFHNDARMVFTAEGDDGEPELRSLHMEEVIPNWAQGEPVTGREGQILSLDVVDGRMASVIFDSDGRFLDQLTLLKIGPDWKIVSKVFIRQTSE